MGCVVLRNTPAVAPPIFPAFARFCAGVSLLTALAWPVGAVEAIVAPTPQGSSLRMLAERRHLDFGASVDPEPLRDETDYRELAGREFSMVTTGNTLKMGPLRPTRNTFFWADADAIVAFAETHAQRVHGHTLVWHRQNPGWLALRSWTRDELLDVLHEHIAAVVGRYKGRVQLWDVVNEAVDDDGSLRPNLWLRIIGPDYIEKAFRWAHEADPAAILLYNDYGGEGLGRKSDAIYGLLRDLRSRGVPVQGVGLQAHLIVGQLPPGDEVRANLKRLAALGLELHITELDIRIHLPVTPVLLEKQANNYRDLLKLFLEFPQARSWTTWGVSDRHSWIPAEFKGCGAALLWDENYRPKPARAALLDVLGEP